MRLIAMFAMHLMGAERARLKVFSFDEGWRLLGDPVGRMLLASLQRMGRSELAVPIISTQLVTDALVGERESLENLIGATFVFGMRSQAEAARALALLGLDPEERAMRSACSSSSRALPVPRPPRPGRGDPGRPGDAVAAAGVLHDPARRVTARSARAGGAVACTPCDRLARPVGPAAPPTPLRAARPTPRRGRARAHHARARRADRRSTTADAGAGAEEPGGDRRARPVTKATRW